MKKRLIDTEIWMNEISDMIKSGYEVPLNVTGNSMLPFLRHDRDRVILSDFKGCAEKGDILLYKRPDGQFILHRVIKAENDKFWFSGDIQNVAEGPVNIDAVIAKVIKAERNGKWILLGDKNWNFYAELSRMPSIVKRGLNTLINIKEKKL